MEVGKTSRGFEVAAFSDANGVACSVQQSSAIGERPEDFDNPGSSFLWIGPDDANPKIMASQAAALGVKTEETTGWVPFPVPDEVLMTTRMHLNRQQVQTLVGFLNTWLRTGRLRNDRT